LSFSDPSDNWDEEALPNLSELDPDSPEFEAAVDAAQEEEDRATGNTEPEIEDEAPEGEAQAVAEDKPAEPAAEAASEPEQKEPGAEAATDSGPIAGVLSADGKRVLPYVALKAERRAASHERKLRETAERERDEARRLIEELKAGKTPDETTSDDLSPEDLEDLKLIGPAGEKVVARLKAAEEALSKVAPAKTAEPEPEDPQQAARERTQEDIDAIPLLLEWQAADPEKFSRAVELDNALKNSRKWADKPQVERFAHVTALVADEFDIPFEQPPRTTTTPKQADPRSVISKAARAAPNTLSDFKGGAIDQGDVRLDKLPPAQALARMSKMDDAQIEAYLARFGG
jgi:hypothetical protein